MAADSPVPLVTEAQFSTGAFADLAAAYTRQTSTPLADILIEATRACESEVQRRLVPFTVTETHRLGMIDPDEYSDTAGLPMDIQSTLGASYAMALGANTLVRHCEVDEYAPRYQDLWSYSNVSVTLIRSYGGTQQLQHGQILNGPEPDTGHLWLQLGTFAPVGTRAQVTYSGGYTVAIPGDLRRGCKFMAAWIIVTELNPEDTNHNPDRLHDSALKLLSKYARNS